MSQFRELFPYPSWVYWVPGMSCAAALVFYLIVKFAIRAYLG